MYNNFHKASGPIEDFILLALTYSCLQVLITMGKKSWKGSEFTFYNGIVIELWQPFYVEYILTEGKICALNGKSLGFSNTLQFEGSLHVKGN